MLAQYSIALLLLIEVSQQLIDLMDQSIDQSRPLLLLIGQFLDLLLVGGLVVVEAVLDGKDVLVDRYSVTEKLHRQGGTF